MYPNRGLNIVRGEGVYLVDDQNTKYLDMMSAISVANLGYTNDRLKHALKSQIDNLIALHSSLPNPIRTEASNLLVQRVQKAGFDEITRVFWCNSGAESIEAALKLAMLHTGKQRFLFTKSGYHGKTLGALSGTSSGEGKYQKPFFHLLLNRTLVEYSHIEDLEANIDDSYAAFVLETIQGESGVIEPSSDYLKQAAELCHKHGVLLILDEIQAGLGRAGKFIAAEHYFSQDAAHKPDIICLAKSLAGGIPVGATLITEAIDASISKGIHTTTFGGNPLAMSGVKAVIEELNNDLLQQVEVNGKYFVNKLKELEAKFPDTLTAVRGVGLFIAIDVVDKALLFLQLLQKNAVIAAPTSGNTIRFLPPLIISKDEIDEGLEAIEKTLNVFSKLI